MTTPGVKYLNSNKRAGTRLITRAIRNIETHTGPRVTSSFLIEIAVKIAYGTISASLHT